MLDKKNFLNTLDLIIKCLPLFVSIVSIIILFVACCMYHFPILYYYKEVAYQLQQQNDEITIVQFHNDLGTQYLYINQIDKAKDEFNQVLKVDPLNPSANKHLLYCDMISEAKNQTTEPAILISQSNLIFKDDPEDSLTHFACGELCFYSSNKLGWSKDNSSNELGWAKDNYTRAIDDDKDNAAAYEGLGLTLDKLGDTKNALNNLTKACNLTNDPVYRKNLADFYYERKEYQNAINEYNKAIDLDHSFLLPYYYLCNSYRLIGDFNDSERISDILIKSLDNNNITKPLNQEKFCFTISSGHNLEMCNLSEKEYYAYYDKALTCYMSEQVNEVGIDKALNSIEEAKALNSIEEAKALNSIEEAKALNTDINFRFHVKDTLNFENETLNKQLYLKNNSKYTDNINNLLYSIH